MASDMVNQAANQSVATKKSVNMSKMSVELTKKHKAAIKIQKIIRGYLVRNNAEYQNKSFRNRSQDPNEKLKIMERQILRVLGLTFVFIFYTDQYRDHILYTIKEITSKKTIVNLRQLSLEDFNDPE
jgi:uncharacterized ion transporter superfamily protein YfcC